MRTVHLLRKYDPRQWGGTETAIQRLFDGLREHGVESVVYAPTVNESIGSDPIRAAGHEVKRFRAFVPILGISAERKRQLISVGGNLLSFDLVSMLKREPRVSVLHTHALGRIGGIALTVARQRGVPLVVTVHGGVLDLPPQMKEDFKRPIGGWDWGRFFGLLFQSHRLFPSADAIVTCNAVEAGLLREKYPDKRIQVQPHGVPVELYRENFRERALAAFPNLRGRRVLLCVGRIDSVKNQGWLVAQMPRVLQSHPDARLVLAGACTDDAYGETLRRDLESLGLCDRVFLTGGLPPADPALIGLFQLADVLLVPSVSETFGLVILEAWAAGTLVLSSRTSGARTLVQDGENGWLFDLDNPDSFHERLGLALSGSAFADQVSRRGAEAARTEFSIPVLAGRMKRLYEELIEEKHALRDSARR